MKYVIDIDNTICHTVGSDYSHSQPIRQRISLVNQLYSNGHHITYWTARGSNSGQDWSRLTAQQLEDWGCRYHELRMGKPAYDVWVDDKAQWIFDS